MLWSWINILHWISLTFKRVWICRIVCSAEKYLLVNHPQPPFSCFSPSCKFLPAPFLVIGSATRAVVEEWVHGSLFGARGPWGLVDARIEPVHGVGDALSEGSVELVAKVRLALWVRGGGRTVIVCVQDVGHWREREDGLFVPWSILTGRGVSARKRVGLGPDQATSLQ